MAENENAITISDVREVTITRDPEQVIADASKAANALKKIVENKAHKFILNGEQYLEFEDWQTVGKFYGLTAKAVSTKLVEIGEVRGYEASAEIIHVVSGQVVSRAESMCLNDEPNWKNKPLFQLRSMAQSRACAKAFRNCLAWVVVLAGYKPTPAEEMEGVTGTEKVLAHDEVKAQRTCPIHNVPLGRFQKGDKVWYAHKVEGTENDWCNGKEVRTGKTK